MRVVVSKFETGKALNGKFSGYSKPKPEYSVFSVFKKLAAREEGRRAAESI